MDGCTGGTVREARHDTTNMSKEEDARERGMQARWERTELIYWRATPMTSGAKTLANVGRARSKVGGLTESRIWRSGTDDRFITSSLLRPAADCGRWPSQKVQLGGLDQGSSWENRSMFHKNISSDMIAFQPSRSATNAPTAPIAPRKAIKLIKGKRGKQYERSARH